MQFLVVVLLLIQLDVGSQTTQRPLAKDPAKTNQVLLAIRQDALSATSEIIDEINLLDDLPSRVLIAEKIVAAMSRTRPDRCRKMLNGIFEDAMALKSDPAKVTSRPHDLDSMLSRIIQAAAMVDLELADLYLEQLSNARDIEGPTKESAPSRASLYLKIATDLSRKNPSLAVSIATRSLAIGISPEILVFLATLREHAPIASDRFLISALQSCQHRGAKDINELLLLYSYVFSPQRVPMVSSQGLSVLYIPGYSEVAKNYGVDAGLARQYINLLGEILFDPNRYIGSNIKTLALGLEGDYYALSIIEPLSASFSPTLTTKIAAQRNALASYLNANQRDAAFAATSRWNSPPNDQTVKAVANETTVDNLIKKAESTSDSTRKDQLYFRAALTAVRLKEFGTALGLVDKISSQFSSKAKQFVQFETALHYVQHDQPLEAARIAQADEMLARRAFILTLIADYFTGKEHKDVSRAVQYLEEVQALAGRLEAKERLSVLIGAASVYGQVDKVRTAELLEQIVQAANSVKDFVGDSSISNVLELGGFYFDYSIYSNQFTIFNLVQRLAADSYYSTLHDVRLLQNRALRLHAIVTLCASVLSDEKH